MNLGDLRGHLRAEVLRDTALPQLWSDSELTTYLNEAYVAFCRRTHLLVDAESDFTTFDTVAGTARYALDPRVLRINRAGILGTDNYQELDTGTRHQIPVTHRGGRPVAFTTQTGIDVGTPGAAQILFYPIPDDVYTVVMEVARKPLSPLAAAADEPEIDEDYHLALCDYAAWRALSNNRPEGANMQAARPFREAFDLIVRDAKRNIALLRAGHHPRAVANWTGKVRR
jgi:hypothetical protein